MRYVSTRGEAQAMDIEGVTLAGLARDGGLYVPEAWPQLTTEDILALRGNRYEDTAFAVMHPFFDDSMSDSDLKSLITAAYSNFSHADVAPLSKLGEDDWLLELFHGPTFAFKDFALQFLGQLFGHVLAKRGETVTILGATSGDTGSAAIEAVRGRENVKVFMLHPKGRVSDVQRKQMTTVADENVFNISIDGTFDDCQNLVKALFNDLEFRDAQSLSAVNSINWVRVLAQVVYYFHAAVKLGAPDRAISFAVPTGNFGDVFAGYVASKMGLPIRKLIIGTNANDILARAFATGEYRTGEVHATISPAMDIQVSSNFERLLFDLYDRDGVMIASLMDQLSKTGGFYISEKALNDARALFAATRVGEEETAETLRAVRTETGRLLDPHTAVGIAAGRRCRDADDEILVSLSTAHAAKFGDAVKGATGSEPEMPARLAALQQLPERCAELGNDAKTLKAYIAERSGR